MPENWQAILDSIQAQLDTAVAAADARAAVLPSATHEPPSTARRGDIAALAARVEALTQCRAQSQTLADEADRVLASAEELLRWRLAEAEALHQRLAAWTGRAIG